MCHVHRTPLSPVQKLRGAAVSNLEARLVTRMLPEGLFTARPRTVFVRILIGPQMEASPLKEQDSVYVLYVFRQSPLQPNSRNILQVSCEHVRRMPQTSSKCVRDISQSLP